MTRCHHCGSRIFFWPKRSGDQTFCDDACWQEGLIDALASEVPPGVFRERLHVARQGPCSVCGGRGPIDFHTGYRVWSLILLTSWKSVPQLSCRSCGLKHQLTSAGFCLLFGWWGFPFGLIMTPVQLSRNVRGLLRPSESNASPELEQLVRRRLAAEVAAGKSRPQP